MLNKIYFIKVVDKTKGDFVVLNDIHFINEGLLVSRRNLSIKNI